MDHPYIFLFQPMPINHLTGQVSQALQCHTEKVSRKEYPKLWMLTDQLNQQSRHTPQAATHRHRTVLALLNWIIGLVAVIPGLLVPQELFAVLIVGWIALASGLFFLFRRQRLLSTILNLVMGAIISLGVLGNREQLGALTPLGLWLMAVGFLSLATLHSVPRPTKFDRAAQTLLQEREHLPPNTTLQATFTPEELLLVVGSADGTTQDSRSIPYDSIEQVVETQDLLVITDARYISLIHKRDLVSGDLDELRAFLQQRVAYTQCSQSA